MPKTYSSVWIHTVWTTKDRNPLLDKKFRVALCSHKSEKMQWKKASSSI